jgi:aspartyl-tRNA(Asn)/glutamyl-tRNA(Gln) amidotransferase subunit A
MLAIIAGYHASDECCVDRPVDDYVGALSGELSGLRVGVERRNHFPDGADPALAACFDAAVAALTELGADVVEVELPYYAEMNAALWLMMSAEGSAYHRDDLRSRWGDYYAQTRTNLARGVLASGADYVQGARVRRLAQRALGEVFETVDVIVSPTAAVGAPTSEEMSTPSIERLMATIFTGYWDAVGNPALAVPMGFTAAGMPLSLQIAGRPFEEAAVLRVGDAYQQLTDWHLRLPSLLTDTFAAV